MKTIKELKRAGCLIHTTEGGATIINGPIGTDWVVCFKTVRAARKHATELLKKYK